MSDLQRVTLDEVVRHFAELEDPRSTVNRQHPLVSVVVIALMAVLAGASGPTAIARWAALKEEFLLETLDGGRLESWWNLCTQGRMRASLSKTHP